MRGVIIGAEHRTEAAACRAVQRTQEVLRRPVALPSAIEHDPASVGKDYLFDALIGMLARRPVQWRLVFTIGEPGDPTDDATKPWPAARRSIDAGTITITAAQTEEAGNARDINFDPTVLPDGITVSDDPLLAARSAVYARSFTRRAEEPKSPSEVDVRRVHS